MQNALASKASLMKRVEFLDTFKIQKKTPVWLCRAMNELHL